MNYYSQVLGRDSELKPQDINLSAVYQQYLLIQRMQFKVTEQLRMVQDPESKSMNLTGVAVTYPGLIPNKGDMFLADIGDGREGIFAITTAEKKTHLKDAIYSIEYQLVDYSSNAHRLVDLNSKVQKSYHFVDDYLTFGQNPKITTSEFTQREDLQREFTNLVGLYFRDFFSNEQRTLLIPGQEFVSYDPYVTYTVLQLIGTDDHPHVAQIRLPNVRGAQGSNVTTLWDCLERMNHSMLYTSVHQMRLIDSSFFKSFPQYSGVYFTGVKKVIYPLDHRTDVDASYDFACDPEMTTAESVTVGGRRFTDLLRLLPSPNLMGFVYVEPSGEQLPDIIRVTDDPYYVLSEAFYRGQTPLKSNLERLVLQGLKREPLDKAALLRIARAAVKWENVERFYYIPILFSLLRVAIRTN